MKTRRCFALLLALMLVLTGCAANAAEEEEEPSGDTAGADWRTWGWVNDAGTLTRDGEEIDVLACVFTDSIMLYLDDETQTVVGVAEYPETMDDAREAYVSVSLDEQQRISIHKSGDARTLSLRRCFLRAQGKSEGAVKKFFCCKIIWFFNGLKLKSFKMLNSKIF